MTNAGMQPLCSETHQCTLQRHGDVTVTALRFVMRGFVAGIIAAAWYVPRCRRVNLFRHLRHGIPALGLEPKELHSRGMHA
jgi:hypothetical protein